MSVDYVSDEYAHSQNVDESSIMYAAFINILGIRFYFLYLISSCIV